MTRNTRRTAGVLIFAVGIGYAIAWYPAAVIIVMLIILGTVAVRS